jgi:hypothetical protein
MADDDILAQIDAFGGGRSEPPYGGTQGKQNYIGVPDDYVAAGNVIPTTTFSDRTGRAGTAYLPGVAAPTYVTGSEYRMRALSPERIAALQSQLARAGLIGPKQTFRVGVWDEVSAAAYRKVLAYANQGGIDEDSALNDLQFDAASNRGVLMRGDGAVAGGSGSAAPKAPEPGNVTRLTSGTSLEEQIQQAARNRLGRKLRKSEVSRFVSIYHGIEKEDSAALNAADDQVQAGADVTITEAPTPDTAASQFMDHNYAQEEAGNKAFGYLQAIQNLVGG